jgi:hypothetical protein
LWTRFRLGTAPLKGNDHGNGIIGRGCAPGSRRCGSVRVSRVAPQGK